MKTSLSTSMMGVVILSLILMQLDFTDNVFLIEAINGALESSGTIQSATDPGIGHESHQLAIILPPTDNIYSGSFSYSASEPIQLVVLHAPILESQASGQPIWTPDGETLFPLTFVDPNNNEGTWKFSGAALAVHTMNSEPFTVNYSVRYYEVERTSSNSGTISSMQDPGQGHENHEWVLLLPISETPQTGLLTYSASTSESGFEFVGLDGPLAEGEDVGQPIWTPDGETKFELKVLTGKPQMGTWEFSASTVALHSSIPKPFTVSYSLGPSPPVAPPIPEPTQEEQVIEEPQPEPEPEPEPLPQREPVPLRVFTDEFYESGDFIRVWGNADPTLSYQNKVELVQNSARVVDAFGNKIMGISVDQQVQLTAELANKQNKDQSFAFLAQIQNDDDVTVSLAWITGVLAPEQSFSPALSWTPQEPGLYQAKIFVWENVNKAISLSPPISLSIKVPSTANPVTVGPIISNQTAPIALKIINPIDNILRIDQFVPTSDGTFSKLYKAEGPLWKKSGTHTVIVHQDNNQAMTSFSFTFLEQPESMREEEPEPIREEEPEPIREEEPEPMREELVCGSGTVLKDGVCVVEERSPDVDPVTIIVITSGIAAAAGGGLYAWHKIHRGNGQNRGQQGDGPQTKDVDVKIDVEVDLE